MKKHQNREMKDFNYKEVQFHNLIRSTGKWKELFSQKECVVSAILAVGVVIVLFYLYNTISLGEFNELLKNIINLAISTLVGLLGFIISGIAIFTGTITNKLVKNIESDKKAESLIGILFSFYYIGAIIGITVVGYIFMYLFSYSQLPVSTLSICCIGFGLGYLYIYSIFYSISLIGTCLKLFFVSYRYYEPEQKED